MSKKKNDVARAPAAPTTASVEQPKAKAVTPEQPAVAPTPKVPKAPAPPDPRVFTLTGAEFTPGKGFATELYAALRSLGSATAQQAADALLASGAYQKVAPQAARLRPVKPVETLLKLWLAKGVVSAQ